MTALSQIVTAIVDIIADRAVRVRRKLPSAAEFLARHQVALEREEADRVRARARAERVFGPAVISIDGRIYRQMTVAAPSAAPEQLELPLGIAGDRPLEAAQTGADGAGPGFGQRVKLD